MRLIKSADVYLLYTCFRHNTFFIAELHEQMSENRVGRVNYYAGCVEDVETELHINFYLIWANRLAARGGCIGGKLECFVDFKGVDGETVESRRRGDASDGLCGRWWTSRDSC